MKNPYKITVMMTICILITNLAFAELTADFSADQTIIMACNPIQFTDLSSGNPTSWEWDFENDGTIDSYEQNPEWTYNEIGIYSVSLKISDGINEDTELKEDFITVIEAQAPVLISLTPGIGAVTLLWEPIPETKTNHFNFEGGDPSSPLWTIYIIEATFNGTDMETEDEIGVFDGDLLVGTFTMDQICTPENQFENDMIAFSVLVSGPGYVEGNSFTMVAWDESEQIESTSFEYTFNNPYGDAWTGDVFPNGDGQYSMAEFSFFNSGYIPTFNVYKEDGTLVAGGVIGNTYVDSIPPYGTHCYYVTQIMECGIESNPSNIICVGLPPYEGNIFGIITNGIHPIEDALVILEGTSYSATSDQYGEYWIQDIEPGTYDITASAVGYSSETKYDQVLLPSEFLEINFTLLGNQTYDLETGYQFISSHVTTDEPDMLIVVGEILNENLDFIRNSQEQTLQKIGPNWVNNIGNWVFDEGYLVKMFADDSFSIEGLSVDPVTPIPLEVGYCFVSYFPEMQMNAIVAFENIIGDDLSLIRNSSGHSIKKIGPHWVNGIGLCQPNEGYLINMFAEGDLVYPGDGGGVTSINEDFQSQSNYHNIYIPGWLNEREIGYRSWKGKVVGNEKYAQATSLNLNGELVCWLITPRITLFVMNSPVFSFESAHGNWFHNGLSVLISTDFDGSDITAATWTPLDCIIADQNNSADEWIPSGLIDLSSYSGNAYIGFRYEGNGTTSDTTSYYIDNIILADENENLKSIALLEKSEKHWNNVQGSPIEPIWTIYFEKGSMEQGDEIAIFDRENIVGTGLVESENILENAIPVFSNLYEVGEKPIIKVWNKSENKEFVLNDYTFSNPYGDAWTENLFPSEDGEYSLLDFSPAGISDDNETRQTISIYPNPTSGIITIGNLTRMGRVCILEITDITGKTVFQSTIINKQSSIEIDLSRFEKGVYFISTNGDDFKEVKKIVIN
ncbi:MAG: choice-of-anchor J domain-containing protein [Bacteroidales bacterium]|nr:choice-of-anchor J domain-containing protein [Bacteroidales bacterium]